MTIQASHCEAILRGMSKQRDPDGTPLLKRIANGSVPVPECGCWVWVGAVNSDGYGSIRVNGKTLGTHRAAYEATNGPIPRNVHVLHKCDVRSCVNPEHLFLGSHGDNMSDMKQKQRSNRPVGEKNGRAKLSVGDVLEIRASKLGCYRLAQKYKMSKAAMQSIRNGKSWSHLS